MIMVKGERGQRRWRHRERGQGREGERGRGEERREEGNVSNAQWRLNSLYGFEQELHFHSASLATYSVNFRKPRTLVRLVWGLGHVTEVHSVLYQTVDIETETDHKSTNQQTGSQYHF